MDLIIYDNSPNNYYQDIVPTIKFKSLIYIHDSRNIGVIPAYNYALRYSNDNGIDWILRLDQDSCISAELFEQFNECLLRYSDKHTAIVPKIRCNNIIISPSFVKRGGILRPIRKDFSGIPDKQITFINSLSFVNVSKCIHTEVFDDKLPLDMSDHDFTRKLSKDQIYILDVTLEHSLSIMSKSDINPNRYRNIIKGEIYFAKKYFSALDYFIFITRMIFRSVKFILFGKIQYSRIILSELFH